MSGPRNRVLSTAGPALRPTRSSQQPPLPGLRLGLLCVSARGRSVQKAHLGGTRSSEAPGLPPPRLPRHSSGSSLPSPTPPCQKPAVQARLG